MRKYIFGCVFVLGTSVLANPYNSTDLKHYGVLTAAQLLFSQIPSNNQYFPEKFSVQLGVALHDSTFSLGVLGGQAYWRKDPVTLSSAATTMNRVIAKTTAQYYQIPLSQGYGVAAGVDLAGIAVLPGKETLGALKKSLIEYKLVGALTNAVEQKFLENGYLPGEASLMTAGMTGALGGMLAVAYGHRPTAGARLFDGSRLNAAEVINVQVGQALIMESGVRLIPSLLQLAPADAPVKMTLVVLSGVPVIAASKMLKEGSLKNFMIATGMAFLMALTQALTGTALGAIEAL